MRKPTDTNLFIPRRRREVWPFVVTILASVAIGWLAAQGF